MQKKTGKNGWRCLTVGCNPKLDNEADARFHQEEMREEGEHHRVAKKPVRSAEGERRARDRNQSGYYDKWNVGDKHWTQRGYINMGGGRVEKVGVHIDHDDHGALADYRRETHGDPSTEVRQNYEADEDMYGAMSMGEAMAFDDSDEMW